MDHFQMGKSALQARQFYEAENHFRKALKNSAVDLKEEILGNLFVVAKALRPEAAWREATALIREKALKKNWKELLAVIADIETDVPAQRRGFIFELRAEAYFELGMYGDARKLAGQHLEYLLRKKLTPQLAHFAPLYRQRFPLTILFYFHEIIASVLQHDFALTKVCIKRMHETIETRWHQLEDVTGKSKLILLSEMVKTLESYDTGHGEAVLLTHYCRLIYLREAKQPLEKEDWKKLTELLIHDASWRNWKLALELSIAEKDEALIAEVHQRIKTKKGFSFVKFTRHEPALKAWLLERGHDRSRSSVEKDESSTLTDEDLRLSGDVKESPRPDGLTSFLQNEEEQQAEESALRQMRFISPPLEMVPDLIVTYEMLGFGRVVDWLIANYIGSDDYPKLQKRIRYFSVMRDMKKRDFHHALATLEEMLGDHDITLDELKELKYAQGAIYHALGDKKYASRLFAEIEAIDPGYRLLRERNW